MLRLMTGRMQTFLFTKWLIDMDFSSKYMYTCTQYCQPFLHFLHLISDNLAHLLHSKLIHCKQSKFNNLQFSPFSCRVWWEFHELHVHVFWIAGIIHVLVQCMMEVWFMKETLLLGLFSVAFCPKKSLDLHVFVCTHIIVLFHAPFICFSFQQKPANWRPRWQGKNVHWVILVSSACTWSLR